jgi:hypothetical protein
MNWPRILFGGILAGVAWTVLSSVITAFASREFVAAVPQGRLSSPSGGLIALLFAVNLAMGIWAMWLYASIRPRFGPGPRTAVVAGVA